MTTLDLSLFDPNHHIPVQPVRMGNTESYIASVSLEWVDSRVRYASQLPLFDQKIDPESQNVLRSDDTIEELFQRPLDWSRQAPLAQYLATKPSHKFPALLVVLSPAWVDNPHAPQWQQGRATCSAADFTPLHPQLGLLNLQDAAIYALDGQHRLMGIQGLMTLIKTGELQPYNKGKKPVGKLLTVQDLVSQQQLDPSDLQRLSQEQIGIEFVPAVLPGETRAEARQRIRSIFVHVNLMAVQLSQGQLALLNEDNGFAIVARTVAVTHPLLRDEPGRNPRVNWDSATVATKSTVLTTLQALQDMSERFLELKFPHWKAKKKGMVPQRPSDAELAAGIAAFQELFNHLASLTSYRRIQTGEETTDLRRFHFEPGKGGEGNLLFRPVGQIAIVQAIGIMLFKKEHNITEIFEKLDRFDTDGGFSGIEHPQSLWFGVLYDPSRKRIQVAGRNLAVKLLVYLLGGIEETWERAELRESLAKARQMGNNQAMGFQGNSVTLKTINLPQTLN